MRGVFQSSFGLALFAAGLFAASISACKRKAEDPAADAETDPAAAAIPDPALPGLGPGSPALVRTLAAALTAKGPGYVPRTHHLTSEGGPEYTNRLILESSPYLLQHAHNPMNWYAWGDEPFERAAREGKPVLLSIGYSTCHWCHVMERESFEDEEIAAFVNEHFVAIKVDREQRPDVDEVYMSAVQLMTGRGGWPMTLLLTPEREPFFAGTYFPARDGDRGARKGFLTLLRELQDRYAREPTAVVEHASEVSRKLAAAAAGPPPGEVPGAGAIEAGARWLLGRHDPTWGGFGDAPKFPRPADLELLMRYSRRSRDPEALAAVELTLRKIVAGGVHDHIGGGFHRYATDARWLVPHFEKMLYDNAQLASVFVEAWQVTGEDAYGEVALETLAYLDREMSDPGGGFHSATDADSRNPGEGHDEEGWFFTWTPAELTAALGEAGARRVAAHYGVTERGNFEGRNILHTWRSLEQSALEVGLDVHELEAALARDRRRLYEVRGGRPAPARDEKVLASWNGLAMSAFARAGFALDAPEYVSRASRAAEFVLERMRDGDGRLYRSYLAGHASHRGYLDDYAFVIQGLLDLHEASSEARWLEHAVALQAVLDADFHDDAAGGYFLAPADGEVLLVRPKPDYDGAEPAGNSVAALNLSRLAELTGNDEYRARADRVFEALAVTASRSPGSVPKLLVALDHRLDSPLEIFVVSPPGQDPPHALVEVVRRAYVPNRAQLIVDEGTLALHEMLIPALAGKRALKGQATAFVCERGVCQQPTSDPRTLAVALQRVTPYQR